MNRATEQPSEELTIERLANMNDKLSEQLHRQGLFWKSFAILATCVICFGFYWTIQTTEFQSRPAIHEIKRVEAELDKERSLATKHKRDRDLLFSAVSRFVSLKVDSYERQKRPITEASTLHILVEDVNEATAGIDELPAIIFYPPPLAEK